MSETNEKEKLQAEVIRAARAWAAARQAWEETARAVERPSNLSALKGSVRRAERVLLTRLDALDAHEEG